MWKWFRWVLLVLVILIIVAIVIIWLMLPKKEEMKNVSIPTYQDPQCSRTFTPQYGASDYYQGPLFDTHFHIPSTFRSKFNNKSAILQQTVTLEQIVCEFQKEKVQGVLAFYAPNPWLMMIETIFNNESLAQIFNQWIDQGIEIEKGLPQWVHLLYDPLSDDPNEAQQAYDSKVFEGFGELVYLKGQSPRPGAKVDDEISLKIEKIANDNKLVVMVHPEQKDKAGFEKALSQNPDAIFIFHSWDHDDYVMDLMNKYPNVYYTLDAAELYMEEGKYETSETGFIDGFKNNFQKNLERAVEQWKPQIERHPDRYLWGTDRFVAWHYSEEMGRNFEEFARAFISQLEPNLQQYVAYKNAERIIAKDGSALPATSQKEEQKSLGDLPEQARQCIINQIGEENWQKMVNHERPATEQERQAIEQCTR